MGLFKKKKQFGKGLGAQEERFFHLKEFSQGKPNEISFNVLEQKAAQQDEGKRESKFTLPTFGKDKEAAPVEEAAPAAEPKPQVKAAKTADAPKQSKPKKAVKAEKKPKAEKKAKKEQASTSSSFLSAESHLEIARRQRRRKLARRISIAVVSLACVVGLCVGGYFAYQEYERLNTSIGVLHEACDLIEESDTTTVALDEYFQQSFDDDTIATAQALQGQLPDAREKLEGARVYAQKAESELDGSQTDKEAAQHALNAIAARGTLFDVSEQRLAQDITAKQAIDALDSAEASIQEGNALLAQAAEVISNTSNDTVAKSTEYTNAANESFAKAQASVEEAKTYCADAGYSLILEYIAKRQAAIAEALASNEAILIQDKQTAEAHNNAYNTYDAEAVKLAESMPSDFTQPVIDVYAKAVDDLVKQYDQARSEASTNDAYLRDYLKK